MKFTSLGLSLALFLAQIGSAAPTESKPASACTPKALLQKFLTAPTNLTVVSEVIGPDATYISNNYNSPELQRLIPWTGQHYKGGPYAIYSAFTGAKSLWTTKRFETFFLFGDEVNAAAVGNLTYQSPYNNRLVDSLFTVSVNASDCLIQYLTFQIDTFALSITWWVDGAMLFHPHPDPYPYNPVLAQYPNETSITIPKHGKVNHQPKGVHPEWYGSA